MLFGVRCLLWFLCMLLGMLVCMCLFCFVCMLVGWGMWVGWVFCWGAFFSSWYASQLLQDLVPKTKNPMSLGSYCECNGCSPHQDLRMVISWCINCESRGSAVDFLKGLAAEISHNWQLWWTDCICILVIYIYMDVSENSGTPKSSILIGFSIINLLGYHYFWKHLYITKSKCNARCC